VVPTITTTAASAIHATYATSGGYIANAGGADVTARGVCWGTASNPTTNPTSNGTGTGSFASSLTSLTVGTTYYVRAYATNSAGTAYAAQVSLFTIYTLGDSYLGGNIFSISGTYPNQHGLIAYTADLGGIGLPWGNTGASGATATAVGTGNANTNTIVASLYDFAGTAARACYDLVGGGYSDWYLPSKDELVLLMQNKAYVAGFGQPYYWSSSEYDASYAWVVQSSNAISRRDLGKYYSCAVRPIKTF